MEYDASDDFLGDADDEGNNERINRATRTHRNPRKIRNIGSRVTTDRTTPSALLRSTVPSFNDLKTRVGLPKAVFVIPPSMNFPDSIKVEITWPRADDHPLHVWYTELERVGFAPKPYTGPLDVDEVYYKIPRTVDKRAIQAARAVFFQPGERVDAVLAANHQRLSFVVAGTGRSAPSRLHTGSISVSDVTATGALTSKQAPTFMGKRTLSNTYW